MIVRYVPYQPHAFAFGGFEIQMLGAMRASQDAGVDTAPLDFWRRDEAVDVVHLWGLEVAQMHTAYWARQAGRAIVLTALLDYMESWKARAHFFASALTGKYRLLRRLCAWADVLVVVNELQAQVAMRFLGCPHERVVIIPNIVEDVYWSPPEQSESGGLEVEDFILCTGNICRRKGQLELARACLTAGLPLVLVGPPLTGEEGYARELARVISASANIKWIPGLEPASAELMAIYRRCAAFALPSFQETQPISALEAGVVGRAVLLGDAAYAHQRYFCGARTINSCSQRDLARGLEDVVSEPTQYLLAIDSLKECRREKVGAAYRAVYERALDASRSRRPVA